MRILIALSLAATSDAFRLMSDIAYAGSQKALGRRRG